MSLKNFVIILTLSISSFIAHANTNANGKLIDGGQLDWQVATYTESHLNNTDQSEANGVNANISLNKNGTSNVGGHNNGHDRQGITLATVGKTKQGKQIGANQDLNHSQRITKDHKTGGLNAGITLDHRLLHQEGRKAIKEDFDTLAKGTGIKADLSKQGDLNNKNVFINGVLNEVDEAKRSGVGITGKENPQIWHNPTHGFLYDLIESALDYTGIGSANSHRVDQWMKQNKNLIIHAHSQGTLLIEQGARNNRNNGHTINTYGNPWRPFANTENNIQKRFGWLNEKDNERIKIKRHDGDFVSKPLNSLIPKNWDELGHSMEDYIKSKKSDTK